MNGGTLAYGSEDQTVCKSCQDGQWNVQGSVHGIRNNTADSFKMYTPVRVAKVRVVLSSRFIDCC